MGNILKISCKELYKTGMYINSQVLELNQVLEHMKKINSDIKAAWDGTDYDEFYNNFNDYLTSIKALEYSLINQTSVIKSVSSKHGRIDKALYDELTRRVKDER